jgi:plastocyanin
MRIPILSVLLAVSVAACGGGSKPADDLDLGGAVPSGSGPKVDAATAGELKGTVMIDGMAPKNEAIRMNADPVCQREAKGPQTQETYEVGTDGKSLANVFVYVKDGLGNYSYDPPTTMAVIDQKECRYHPHVFGMRVGQPLEIVNDDPTLHNIHAIPKVNSEFNNGQPIQGMKMTHTFDKPEVMVPFKCDVHGWMNAYVGVLDHPYFAVTDETGSFDIKNLPPGTYTIEAWHEKLGTMQQMVTIGEKETKDANFTFTVAATTATSD